MERLPNENVESDEETTEELVSDDEMCSYEKLRMRNIAQIQKKFQEFKLANLVSTVSSAYENKKTNPKKSAKEVVHSDDEFESYAQPSTSRVLPKRNCNQIISYEDKNSSDSDDEPKTEANWNESTKISAQNEVNDITKNDENSEPEEYEYDPNDDSDTNGFNIADMFRQGSSSSDSDD